MTRQLTQLAAVLALAAALAGCSNGPPSGAPMAEPHPTHGRITFPDKTPLRGGVINFIPVEIKAGFKVRYQGAALVDAQGNYKIGFNGDGKGVPAGEYKVVIEPRDYQELKGSNTKKIPAKYRDKESTPLTLTVKEGDNTFDIVLK